MREAMFWEAGEGGQAHCLLCPHSCRIGAHQKGLCGVRSNQEGKLYSTADALAAAALDPVEKKPLFHFLPGSLTFSIAAAGCNMSCLFCQNSELSQSPKTGQRLAGHRTEARDIVKAALENGALSISYTYSEPTVFWELVLETSRLAASQGLKNILVSNGFISDAALRAAGPYIHAVNFDLKSFDNGFYERICAARLEPVLASIRTAVELGWWLELTTLLIPGLNDSSAELNAMAGFIAGLPHGRDIPWHISRFHPCYKLLDRPATPLESLNDALNIGQAHGLNYIYAGNIPGHQAENTRCPACGETLIARQGFHCAVRGIDLSAGTCANCGRKIAGVWQN